MENIKKYITDRGYTCVPGLVENYYLSLMSRPFVILTGMSDTDMTLLPELFANALGATRENGRYRYLPVEYDWMDSSDLFGHLDLWGKFVPGAIMDFLVQARDDRSHPYFLCFDKLILSRAEYYLREILNIIDAVQAGQNPGDLVPGVYYGRDAAAAETYGQIPALENLYIVGTLALDETGFPLNQKFMDRVHTLQVEKEDVVFTGPQNSARAVCRTNDFLQSPLQRLEQCGAYSEKITQIIAVIEEMNKILMRGNAYVGYKIRNDIILYMINNCRAGVLDEAAAMDHLITRKILLRAQGNGAAVQPVLEQLGVYCAGRYPQAEKKIAQMLEKCRTEGYTAYWI